MDLSTGQPARSIEFNVNRPVRFEILQVVTGTSSTISARAPPASKKEKKKTARGHRGPSSSLRLEMTVCTVRFERPNRPGVLIDLSHSMHGMDLQLSQPSRSQKRRNRSASKDRDLSRSVVGYPSPQLPEIRWAGQRLYGCFAQTHTTTPPRPSSMKGTGAPVLVPLSSFQGRPRFLSP